MRGRRSCGELCTQRIIPHDNMKVADGSDFMHAIGGMIEYSQAEFYLVPNSKELNLLGI
jgi:hypothetical protein